MTGMIDKRVCQITQRSFDLGGWVAVKSMVKGYEHYFMTGVFFESDFPCSEYTCVTD